MRINADAATIDALLRRIAPDVADPDLPRRIHRRLRSLTGHWAATEFGESMVLHWPPDPP